MASQEVVLQPNINDNNCSNDTNEIKLELITLPQFNITNIIRCLPVTERLRVFVLVHSRLYDFVMTPQSFPDVSFYPIHDDQMYDPKIISGNPNGITYLRINVFSQHTFVKKVALLAGMWNFKVDVWNTVDWPINAQLESLQLTLERSSKSKIINLREKPCLKNINKYESTHVIIPNNEKRYNNNNNNNNSIHDSGGGGICIGTQTETIIYDNNVNRNHHHWDPMYNTRYECDYYSARMEEDVTGDIIITHDTNMEIDWDTPDEYYIDAIKRRVFSNNNNNLNSYETTKDNSVEKIEYRSSYMIRNEYNNNKEKSDKFEFGSVKLRNLFFIKFDGTSKTPKVLFPDTLWGLGLQTFDSSLFAQKWWKNQIIYMQTFENLRFLVLSCCEFKNNELQELVYNCKYIEHLSLRYCQWNGIITFPSSLVSLGWFPCEEYVGRYNVSKLNNLWQFHTRLHENSNETINMLNKLYTNINIKRVKFEIIKDHNESQPWLDIINWDNIKPWLKRKNMYIIITKNDLKNNPNVRNIFPFVKLSNYINIDETDFGDCPMWSNQANEFIEMTRNRKLLLR
mmetsp:Transcript_39967/g.49365  ORF Transcript_39967/g.49365 Transcript_39967/m.49365 type:complete len:569 (-) Transcript_39967:50-1756(-)